MAVGLAVCWVDWWVVWKDVVKVVTMVGVKDAW